MSVITLSQRSGQNLDQQYESRNTDECLWAVVFEGRIRVSVMAPDVDAAVERGRLLMPGALVVKVYER